MEARRFPKAQSHEGVVMMQGRQALHHDCAEWDVQVGELAPHAYYNPD